MGGDVVGPGGHRIPDLGVFVPTRVRGESRDSARAGKPAGWSTCARPFTGNCRAAGLPANERRQSVTPPPRAENLFSADIMAAHDLQEAGVIGKAQRLRRPRDIDRKSTRLNSSHTVISYAVFCLKKKKHIK